MAKLATKPTVAQIRKIFKDFNELNILIIGDLMLDHYIIGKVNRLSPEAPVPIVNVERKEFRLGGAGNVIQNVAALGCKPLVCSVIGDDEYTPLFLGLLKKDKLDVSGIVTSGTRKTTVKTRVIGNNHHMVRIDEEVEAPLDKTDKEKLLAHITKTLQKKKVDVVIFEDYDKGVISPDLIQEVISLAHKRGIPVAVDPKKKNFAHYKKADLFKPNLKELKEGLKLDFQVKNIKELDKAIQLLIDHLGIDTAFVTLSELGVYIKNKKEAIHVPAHVRNIADVSGAGDTVISVASACLALKTEKKLLAQLANLAGGLVCEAVGAVPLNKVQLEEEAIKALCK